MKTNKKDESVMTNAKAAGWAVDNAALARGRLLTAARGLSAALAEVNQMIGYLDGSVVAGGFRAGPRYIELGMDAAQRNLLHAIRALDMGNQ